MKLCLSGQSTRGLTNELNDTLRGLYERFALEMYYKAAFGYNLQSLYSMYSRSPKDMLPALHRFTQAALEDLCTMTKDDLEDKAGYQYDGIIADKRWEWTPLPFLWHLRQAASSEIALLRSRNAAGIIDAVGLDALRASLNSSFKRLLARDVVLGNEEAGVVSLFHRLLLASIAQLEGTAGGSSSSAVQELLQAYLRHCFLGTDDVASVLALIAAPNAQLRCQLLAVSHFERTGLLHAADVADAVSRTHFRQLSIGDAERFDDDCSLNMSSLIQSLWNVLIVRLWAGLCHSFGAASELVLVADSGLSTDAGGSVLSPRDWSRVASEAVAAISPVSANSDAVDVVPFQTVVLDCVRIVAPLIGMLFPPHSKESPADATRKLCIREFLTVVREHIFALRAQEGDRLVHMTIVDGALQLLPRVKAGLPTADHDALLEYVERSFLNGCSELSHKLVAETKSEHAGAIIGDVLSTYTPDVRFLLRVINGRIPLHVLLPEAMRITLLSNLYECVKYASVDVRTSVNKWFRSEVNAELDAAAPGPEGLPATFADVVFVPYWFEQAATLNVGGKFDTHACLQCPLAKTLFLMLSRANMVGGEIAGSYLDIAQPLGTLRAAVSHAVSQASRLATPGWYSCIQLEAVQTGLMEAVVSDLCKHSQEPPAAGCERFMLALQALRHQQDRDFQFATVREALTVLFADMPRQMYVLCRALERRDRLYVGQVLHHPANVAILPWLEMFQPCFPVQVVDAGDIVQVSMAGQDVMARLPFMWPRPLADPADEPADEREESKAFHKFYLQTVSAFLPAHDAFRAGGRDACVRELRRANWLGAVAALAGPAGNPSSPARLRARMFVFSIMGFGWFSKDDPNERICYSVFELLEDLAKPEHLDLDVREKALFRVFSNPGLIARDDPGRNDDVTSLLFGTGALSPDDKRLRSVIVAVIATCFGMPRNSHVLHTHLFKPSSLARTFATGSSYNSPLGGAVYDCGSQLTTSIPPVWVNAREPLTDTSVLSSLYIACFGTAAVGMSLFRAEEFTGCYGPVFSRYYDSARANEDRYRAAANLPRDAQDWMVNFAWLRAVSGWSILSM